LFYYFFEKASVSLSKNGPRFSDYSSRIDMPLDLSRALVIRGDEPDAAHVALFKQAGVKAVLPSSVNAASWISCPSAVEPTTMIRYAAGRGVVLCEASDEKRTRIKVIARRASKSVLRVPFFRRSRTSEELS